MKKLLLLNEYNTTIEVFITASSKKPPSRDAHNDKLSVSKFGRTGEFTTCRLSCKLLVLSAVEYLISLSFPLEASHREESHRLVGNPSDLFKIVRKDSGQAGMTGI